MLIPFWRYIYIIFIYKKSQRSHKTVGINVFLTIMLDDRRIRSRILISYYWIWIRIRISKTADIYGLVWFQVSEDACTGQTWSLQSWRKSSRTTAKAFSHSRSGAEALSSRKRLQTRAVLRIRIRDPVPFWPREPGWVESQHPDPGSGMNNPDHIF